MRTKLHIEQTQTERKGKNETFIQNKQQPTKWHKKQLLIKTNTNKNTKQYKTSKTFPH